MKEYLRYYELQSTGKSSLVDATSHAQLHPNVEEEETPDLDVFDIGSEITNKKIRKLKCHNAAKKNYCKGE